MTIAAIVAVTGAVAGDGAEWDFAYKKFSGEYAVYSGQLGEAMPPTRTDRKLSMMIVGELAREMFESMGPDIRNTCGADEGGPGPPKAESVVYLLPS